MDKLQSIDSNLFNDLSLIIEHSKRKVAAQVNSTLTLTYWQIGKRINDDILQNQRAEYGKQVVKSLVSRLTHSFGKGFDERNLRRMMQFAEVLSNFEIVATLSPQLSWSHFIEIIRIENNISRQ